MKKRTITLLVFTSLLLLVGIFVVMQFTPSVRATAFHNAAIQQGEHEATQVNIQCTAAISADYNPDEIDWLLEQLRLPQQFTSAGSFHDCSGHLAISIVTPGKTYSLNYDHGNGMYPITEDGSKWGFIEMAPETCSQLNSHFQSKGFDKLEIGIE